MSFCIEMDYRDSANDYYDALRVYDKAAAKPWRTGGEDFPLPNKRVRHMGVRKLPDGSIAFRLHATDVIVWHRDNTVTITPWPSQSTCVFANSFLPSAVQLCKTGTVLSVSRYPKGPYYGQVFYPVEYDRTVHFDPEAKKPTHKLRSVFSKRLINRAAAKDARDRTNYAEYREWFKLMTSMLGAEAHASALSWETNYHNVLEHLADRECWSKILYSYRCRDLNNLRERIYEQAGDVYYQQTCDTLNTYPEAPWGITGR